MPVTKVIVPTITFFEPNGKISEYANDLLIRHILKNEPDCLFLMGSTGEGLYFRDKPQEKKRYFEIVNKTLSTVKPKPQIPVVVGIYGETATHAIEDAKASLKVLPNAGLVLPPPTKTKLNPDAQKQFFSEALAATTAPLYVYNNPKTFGGTEISVEVLEGLTKYSNFMGIKDSSDSLDQKKAYLRILSKQITVSCGKEGMLAKFLNIVPIPQRAMVGIVPSISNLVNTCAKIFNMGIAGKDKEMLDLQAELNAFREKIYDSTMEKGKAQRGLKLAFAHLYRSQNRPIPTTLRPDFERTLSPDELKSIEDRVDKVRLDGHITLIK